MLEISTKLSSNKSFQRIHGAEVNDSYADFTVSYYAREGRRELRAHRIILATHSEFFKAAIDNKNFRESVNARMYVSLEFIISDLQFEDPRWVLPLIFKYFYEGEINVTPANIIPIIHFADMLLCTELVKLTTIALREMISNFSARFETVQEVNAAAPPPQYSVEIVISMLRDAILFEKSGTVAEIVDSLAPRFDEVGSSNDLSFLEYSVFSALVARPSILLESEYKLYQIISKYVLQKKNDVLAGMESLTLATKPKGSQSANSLNASKSNTQSKQSSYASMYSEHTSSSSQLNLSNSITSDGGSGLSTAQIIELYNYINWENLTIEEMEEVCSSNLVPNKVIINGLLTSLKHARGHTVKSIVRPIRKLRAQNTREFIYSSNFDTHGLIYFLANKTGKVVNPHTFNLVTVGMSSVLIGDPANIVSRTQIPTCTCNENNAWISVDFGSSIDIKVSSYTLMHGSRTDKFNLRSWSLQGSYDADTWESIISHSNDETLGGNYRSGTWFIGETHNEQRTSQKPGKLESGHEKHWRYLRICVKGKYPVQVCGVEFYGTVRSERAIFG